MVTVIVPVYNVEKYLSQCIESLLSQTYKDLEILLIDDGSTDSSSKICDEFEKKDDRIIVIHKKNQGLGLARNTGLENAKGDFVTFVDSDDYLEKNAIEYMINHLMNNNADTFVAGFKKILDNGEIIKCESYEKQILTGQDIKDKFLIKTLGSSPEKKDSIKPAVWSNMYSLTIIKRNNISFPSEREYISEDIIFNLYYYRYAKKVIISDSSNYYYRVNMTSLTRSYREDRYQKTKIMYKKQLELIDEDGLIYEAKLRAMSQFFVSTFVCIKQEKKSISSKNVLESLNKIREICNDDVLNEIIKKYPINKLGIRQKIFIYLLKFKMVLLLYLLVR